MGLRISACVKFLWDEYRTAAQFAPMWDRAVENVELIRRKELAGNLPSQDDLAGLSPVYNRGGSPAHWMTQVDVPAWFIRDELGIGSSVNVYDTARTLDKTNKKRRRDYADMLRRLADARKVLKRSYSV
jgi:hypothetical protein